MVLTGHSLRAEETKRICLGGERQQGTIGNGERSQSSVSEVRGTSFKKLKLSLKNAENDLGVP